MPFTIPPPGDALTSQGPHLSNLKVTAQDSPNLTVKISAGTFWNDDSTYIEYAGGNSPAVTTPLMASKVKMVIVAINLNSNIVLIDGVEVLSNPVLPSVPSDNLPLAALLVNGGISSITTNLIFDIRPVWSIGADLNNISISDVTGLASALADTSALDLKADIGGTPSAIFTLSQDQVGDPGLNNILRVERGNRTDVELRWNELNQEWEFTNDGSTFFQLASGSAGTASEIVEIQASIVQLQASVNDLVTRVSAIEVTTSSNVASQIGDLDLRASALESSTTRIDASIININASLVNLHASVDANASRIFVLNTSVTDINASLVQLHASVDQNASVIGTLQASVAGLGSTVTANASLITITNASVAANASRIVVVEASVADKLDKSGGTMIGNISMASPLVALATDQGGILRSGPGGETWSATGAGPTSIGFVVNGCNSQTNKILVVRETEAAGSDHLFHVDTGGSVHIRQALPILSGGTGASTAAAAITNLGLDVDALLNASVPSPNDGDVLRFRTSTTQWVASAGGGGAGALPDLTDVESTTTSGAGGGQVLTFNSGSGRWENQDSAAGGGGAGVLQIITTVNGNAINSATIIPYDNTIPEITEGLEVVAVTITPNNATNILVIEARTDGVLTATPNVAVGAIFQGGVTNALTAGRSQTADEANIGGQINLSHTMTAGATTPLTFSLRAGPNATGEFRMNAGNDGTQRMGGTSNTYIRVIEYELVTTDFNTYGTDSSIILPGGLIINFGTITPTDGLFTWTYPRAFTTAVFFAGGNVSLTPNVDFEDRVVRMTSPPGLTTALGTVTFNGTLSNATANLIAFGH